ncbi:conserved Plasmodium protein, unknown function [Plasmodium chabaudi chabaudi]|uniref:Pinin/SDK/MemA protein domain-containing protein n=1 Tax=Plasmodium chabaudi chabaudi TaxID=31271 RepID=A0A1C6YRK8_PLACU|nr:conserved Plasmodium protein, unknown function [Plasmodium chabaudi chabaudi]
MKKYLSEENKLKITIRKDYFERENIKAKILSNINRLTHLCLDEKTEHPKNEPAKRVPSNENIENDPSFEVEKRPKLNEDEKTVTRNKRLLQSFLFDHLKKAKDALEDEKTNKTIIMQQAQNKRVEAKLLEEKKKIEKNEIFDIEKKTIILIDDIKMLEENIKKNEGKFMKMSLISHYDKMKNFISTNTSPTIFWCPLKFNEKMKTLQKGTHEFINKKIEEIESANYEVEFEEESWVKEFDNLREIIKRKSAENGDEKGEEKGGDNEEENKEKNEGENEEENEEENGEDKEEEDEEENEEENVEENEEES